MVIFRTNHKGFFWCTMHAPKRFCMEGEVVCCPWGISTRFWGTCCTLGTSVTPCGGWPFCPNGLGCSSARRSWRQLRASPGSVGFHRSGHSSGFGQVWTQPGREALAASHCWVNFFWGAGIGSLLGWMYPGGASPSGCGAADPQQRLGLGMKGDSSCRLPAS